MPSCVAFVVAAFMSCHAMRVQRISGGWGPAIITKCRASVSMMGTFGCPLRAPEKEKKKKKSKTRCTCVVTMTHGFRSVVVLTCGTFFSSVNRPILSGRGIRARDADHDGGSRAVFCPGRRRDHTNLKYVM